MTNKRTRRKFDDEFKKEAVSLVTEQGYSVANAAQAVDVGENNLRRWLSKFESEADSDRLNSDERAELNRLRKENKKLLLEKEILKKASAFFAKEMK